jgi:opacity protein-like surface antigen
MLLPFNRRFVACIISAVISFPVTHTVYARGEDSTAVDGGTPPLSLPIGESATASLSGGIYLFQYLPTDNVDQSKFEVYAFVANVDVLTSDNMFGLHVQTRIRDTKLRDFFFSNIWFQEAYAFVRLPLGEIRAGKIYRNVGIFWDDSFFGNVHYFNGLKLNPDFGVALAGSPVDLHDNITMGYSLQYFANNDHVDGSLPGRDVESDADAHQRHTLTARLQPTVQISKTVALSVGVSGLYGRIRRSVGPDFSLNQLAGDITLTAGPVNAFVELLRQSGERNDGNHPFGRTGYDNSTYVLGGLHWNFSHNLTARINYSSARYDGTSATEYELVPGVVFQASKNIGLIVEYDYWQTKPDTGPLTIIDRSVNIVIHCSF